MSLGADADASCYSKLPISVDEIAKTITARKNFK